MLMKKIFTLFASSLLDLGVSAQDESGVIEGCGWMATGVAPEAGATLIDDFYVTAKTVYATTVTADEFNTYAGAYIFGPGNHFTHRMNVRVDAWPNPDNLTGTEKSGSTPVILEVKYPTPIMFYFRRQYGDGYVAGDGKDIRIFSHPDATVIQGEMLEVNDLDGSFGNCVEMFYMPVGTYTIAAKGTTLGLFGFIYDYPIGVSDVAVDATGGEAVYYNLNGVKVANPENGLYIKVQGGKATKVIR